MVLISALYCDVPLLALCNVVYIFRGYEYPGAIVYITLVQMLTDMMSREVPSPENTPSVMYNRRV